MHHAPGTRIPYTTNLPRARAIEDDVLLVHTWEGRPLPREHGGPCRMITPKLYAWKGTKWIRRIDFLAHNERGFWEERGYSDTAEPWFNDRYTKDGRSCYNGTSVRSEPCAGVIFRGVVSSNGKEHHP